MKVVADVMVELIAGVVPSVSPVPSLGVPVLLGGVLVDDPGANVVVKPGVLCLFFVVAGVELLAVASLGIPVCAVVEEVELEAVVLCTSFVELVEIPGGGVLCSIAVVL